MKHARLHLCFEQSGGVRKGGGNTNKHPGPCMRDKHNRETEQLQIKAEKTIESCPPPPRDKKTVPPQEQPFVNLVVPMFPSTDCSERFSRMCNTENEPLARLIWVQHILK